MAGSKRVSLFTPMFAFSSSTKACCSRASGSVCNSLSKELRPYITSWDGVAAKQGRGTIMKRRLIML